MPPVGGTPCPFGEALRCFDLPRFAWATETRKVGGWSLFRFGQFFGRNGTDRKGHEKATAFLGRKIRRPLRARNRMESNGKGMSAKGAVLAVSGLRHPPKVERNADAGAGIRCECPKDARNGAVELTKRRGRVILCPRVRKRLYGRLNASARVRVSVAEAKQEVFRRCQTVSSATVRLRSVRQCPKEGRNRPAMPFSLSANPIPLPGALKRS